MYGSLLRVVACGTASLKESAIRPVADRVIREKDDELWRVV